MAKIAILGYGVVGSGVAQVIYENQKRIAERLNGEAIDIKYILDLRDFPGDPLEDRVVHDFNIILNDPEISVVAEMMGGVHPAYEFSMSAICSGKSVVTSNKELVANCGPELLRAANEHGVRYRYEASVGGGIPCIAAIENSMISNEITEINGIVNGTTNYILTKMFECGLSFDECLKDAQQKGYAEADPAADIEGKDACRKICILAALAFGKLVPPDEVDTVGISKITKEDVERAAAKGCTIKLIARAVRLPNGKIHMRVAPFMVKNSNPLANISDVFNGVLVHGNAVGDVLFYGAGAGKRPTASAVVSDIIDIIMYRDEKRPNLEWVRDASVYEKTLPAEYEQAMHESLGYVLA